VHPLGEALGDKESMRATTLLPALLLGVVLVGCSGCKTSTAAADGGACRLVEGGPGPEGQVPIRVEVVADGLEVPWAIGHLPGGDLLVTERPGRLRLVRDGVLQQAPVASLEAVLHVGEGGLLGLAVHPDFENNRLFFIYFTTGEQGASQNRVERWRLAPDGNSAERDAVVLEGLPAARVHDGGRLRIGPDGMLYVSVGDVQDPQSGQDLQALSGKLLRLTLEGEVPQDNPDPTGPVWLSGLRNSQGFDWLDPQTMVVADHGPSGDLGRRGHDELTVARRGDNLGWPTIYGCQSREGMRTPAISWVQAVPPGGAAVYRGQELSEWRGSVLLGALGARHLQRVVLSEDGQTATTHEVYLRGDPPGGYGRLRDVSMGLDGHLYVTTSNCDGRGNCPSHMDQILRIRRGEGRP
jgi:aldose sugar dehydrogenase